ncbi:MAG: hypothetical protein C0514_09235 [Candidatus Puniceispirillum sp.]|nr:hypothetical protein [Candidatus Puniceispirillum sp.]
MTICLLSTTSLFASMGEEDAPQEAPSCAPITGKKRSYTHAYKGKEEDLDTVKKQKADPEEKAQEAASQTVVFASPLELLPNELLVYVSRFLPHQDFLSFAAMNKHTREVLFATYFSNPIPPRTWRLALDFDEIARTGSTGLIFENVVMQRTLRDFLIMFRGKNAKSVTDLRSTLTTYGSFTYQGKILSQTPLWQLMEDADANNPQALDLTSLPAQDNLGDADALFLNMLHTIKANFSADPATLAHYRAPAHDSHTSPQARLYHADSLRRQLQHIEDAIERALKWNEIYDAFPYVDPKEIIGVASDYWSAGCDAEDPAQEGMFLGKSAHFYDLLYTSLSEPTVRQVMSVASLYQSAAQVMENKDDKRRYYLKSAQWLDRFFLNALAPDPEANRQAAQTYDAGAKALFGTPHYAPLVLKSKERWDAYLFQVPNPGLEETKSAADVYRRACGVMANKVFVYPTLMKSVNLWDSYLARQENPSVEDMRGATHAYLQASHTSLVKAERFAVLQKGLALTQRYLPLVGEPTWVDLKLQAMLHYGMACAHTDPSQQKAHFLASAPFWSALQKRAGSLNHTEARLSGMAYRQAALHSDDLSQKLAYLEKANEMFTQFLANEKEPEKLIVSYARQVSGLLQVLRLRMEIQAPQDAQTQGH